MDALQKLIFIAKNFGDKPVINVSKTGNLGIYTDDSGVTEWAKLNKIDWRHRQVQLLSYVRSNQSFWLGAYIGHLNYLETSRNCNH
jgi:hypothetical protein